MIKNCFTIDVRNIIVRIPCTTCYKLSPENTNAARQLQNKFMNAWKQGRILA
jgi:hypothetical protein